MLSDGVLGKSVEYPDQLDRGLLFPIPRFEKRQELGIDENALPFQGIDIWNAYEVSWLNAKGKPQVALAEFTFPCSSEFLIESKSFKLYLNSFNQSRQASNDQVISIMRRDLSAACGENVWVKLSPISQQSTNRVQTLSGVLLDELDIEVDEYAYNPNLLKCSEESIQVDEVLQSHLLKSNCLVTGQPDWGSVQIAYTGSSIDRVALLKYLISFRQHNEFHEQCVERIFCDIMHYCQPQKLSVYARYTRRGGLDINTFRSNHTATVDNIRLIRQ